MDIKPRLSIELVPQRSWFTNVRSKVSKHNWDRIRHASYLKAGFKCEICGGKGSKWPVECHEIWRYNDKKREQKLMGMIALCPDCHMVKHYGYAQIQGNEQKAFNHLIKVNGWSVKEGIEYVKKAFETWMERSEFDYEIDVDYLKEAFGITEEEINEGQESDIGANS